MLACYTFAVMLSATARAATTPESHPDWWMISLTAGLVIVGGVQAWLLKRQAYIINEGLKETRTATGLTRETIVLTQRPKVIVRNVSVFAEDPGAALFEAGKSVSLKGSIFLVNVGNTAAHIIGASSGVFRDVLPMIPPYMGSLGSIIDIDLKPGNGTPWHFETILPQVTDSDIYRKLRESSIPVYVLGRITYSDQLGTIRITGFCRQWNAATKRFSDLNSPDPDYEYAD